MSGRLEGRIAITGAGLSAPAGNGRATAVRFAEGAKILRSIAVSIASKKRSNA